MSRIVTEWQCENCKEKFNQYISFGHPNEDFDFKWQCDKCDHVNTLHVKALPRRLSDLGWL